MVFFFAWFTQRCRHSNFNSLCYRMIIVKTDNMRNEPYVCIAHQLLRCKRNHVFFSVRSKKKKRQQQPFIVAKGEITYFLLHLNDVYTYGFNVILSIIISSKYYNYFCVIKREYVCSLRRSAIVCCWRQLLFRSMLLLFVLWLCQRWLLFTAHAAVHKNHSSSFSFRSYWSQLMIIIVEFTSVFHTRRDRRYGFSRAKLCDTCVRESILIHLQCNSADYNGVDMRLNTFTHSVSHRLSTTK